MAGPNDSPDLPDLNEFAARILKASDAVDEFAQTTTTAAATASQQSDVAPQASDAALSRELINMLSLIHDEAIAIRGLLEDLTK